MLKRSGKLTIVGNPRNADRPLIGAGQLLGLNRRINGSSVGGIKETQEMQDYSVANNIYPVVEIISANPDTVAQAYPKVVNGEVRFRYVIDMQTLE